MKRSLTLGVCVLVALSSVELCRAATLFAVDDFEDGSIEGWEGGNLPTNIPSGGPNGEGDHYLQLTPRGAIGPGGNLAAFNLGPDWIGDYGSVGAKLIEMDMLNTESNLIDLEMRIVLFGPTSTNERWTSASPFLLARDGAWHNAAFSLAEEDIVQVGGTGTYEDMMANVLRVMVRLDSDTPSFGGEPTDSVLALDNIVLLPEAIPGDKNGDGAVDAADAGQMFSNWGTADPDCDLNNDGIVDAADASVLFANWTGDSAVEAVPEPVGLGWCLAIAMLGVRTRRRQVA